MKQKITMSIESDVVKHANRLLALLEEADTIQPLNDKELLKNHLDRKYG